MNKTLFAQIWPVKKKRSNRGLEQGGSEKAGKIPKTGGKEDKTGETFEIALKKEKKKSKTKILSEQKREQIVSSAVRSPGGAPWKPLVKGTKGMPSDPRGASNLCGRVCDRERGKPVLGGGGDKELGGTISHCKNGG